jgi:hypothetical protein
MTADYDVGVLVAGPISAPRHLVEYRRTLEAFADGDVEFADESYLSHFVFGPEMETHYKRNGGSVAGFNGPCCCRWLTLDIDRPNLDTALADARRLVAFIRERYRTDPIVWFSGLKGFHIFIKLAHNPPPSVGFHRIARTFAETLAAAANVQIDRNIYDIAHLIRLPNTRHPKTGLFKRRIDADDLFRFDLNTIRRHAAHPAGDGLPPWCGDTERLAADWRDAEAATARATEARTAICRDFRPDVRAPRYLLEFLRFGAIEGERAMMAFRCAAWLSEQGCPEKLVFALLTEAALDCGLSPSETARQIACGIAHAQKQRAAADPPPDPNTDPDAFERWAIRHENDPLPPGATDFPFGANVSEGGPP